jgi:hypothetical protein
MIWLIFFLILQTKPSFCRLFACSQLGFPATPYVEAATMTVTPSHVLSPEYTVQYMFSHPHVHVHVHVISCFE